MLDIYCNCIIYPKKCKETIIYQLINRTEITPIVIAISCIFLNLSLKNILDAKQLSTAPQTAMIGKRTVALKTDER